jgi:hypothetical protein
MGCPTTGSHSQRPASTPPTHTFAEVEPIDSDAKDEKAPLSTRFATPARTASKKPADVQRKQRKMMDEWIRDPHNPLQDKDRIMMNSILNLPRMSLSMCTSSKSATTRPAVTLSNGSCQWKQNEELVNSARISAVQAGQSFAWRQCREEILKSLTDITLTARFLALSRLRR